MPLTLPNLDDRGYNDLIEEARSLWVTYAPALTNHNPTDPLVTLTELFAYFTDVLLFRLNYITDANRISFLKLLNGPQWQPPSTREELDAEVRRAVLAVRSIDRAVTALDFEQLALMASPGDVARARCIVDRNLETTNVQQRNRPSPGNVSVVIVPAIGVGFGKVKSIVVDYLEPRRLLATRVHVVGPTYLSIRVRVKLHLLPDALESVVRPKVLETLSSYFDPIAGYGGRGWPFGRNIYVSDVYRLLDSLDGVDFVTRIKNGDTEEDELAPIDVEDAADRSIRNDQGELISIALQFDELVQFQPISTDIEINSSSTAAVNKTRAP